jgi:hypothetical protein
MSTMDIMTINMIEQTEIKALYQVPISAKTTAITAITATIATPTTVFGILFIFSLSNNFFIEPYDCQHKQL